MSASTAMTCPIVFGPASMAASRALLKKKAYGTGNLPMTRSQGCNIIFVAKKAKKALVVKPKIQAKRIKKVSAKKKEKRWATQPQLCPQHLLKEAYNLTGLRQAQRSNTMCIRHNILLRQINIAIQLLAEHSKSLMVATTVPINPPGSKNYGGHILHRDAWMRPALQIRNPIARKPAQRFHSWQFSSRCAPA